MKTLNLNQLSRTLLTFSDTLPASSLLPTAVPDAAELARAFNQQGEPNHDDCCE